MDIIKGVKGSDFRVQDTDLRTEPSSLLKLLQLASPALPVGAYSYSEGLEFLIESGRIHHQESLWCWLDQELHFGSIRVDTAIMVRAYDNMLQQDWQVLQYWNSWLSAARETEELRQQNWQMGQSLLGLLVELEPDLQSIPDLLSPPYNFAIAFGLSAAHWKIDREWAVLGYLQSWLANLINVGVKLIPLGQTSGQVLLLQFTPLLHETTQRILTLKDQDLGSCSWGLSLASMNHETLYTRLFRS